MKITQLVLMLGVALLLGACEQDNSISLTGANAVYNPINVDSKTDDGETNTNIGDRDESTTDNSVTNPEPEAEEEPEAGGEG